MKIAFINDRIYSYAAKASDAVGGAERQQWLLARALSAAGWQVAVGVRETLDVNQRETIDGIDFVGLEPGNPLRAWYRFLAAEQPDWWYWRAASHLWGPAVEIAKLTGVRAIFAAAFDTDVNPSRALTRRQRWWPLYAWGLKRSDRIFVQHGGQLSNLTQKLRSKAWVVPSIAAEPAPFVPHQDREDYVAWVAMLREPKRPDLLVEIARRAPEIRFIVCGAASTHRSSEGYGEKIEAALRELPNVDFQGQVSPGRAKEVIGGASLLLSTSDAEGFPNTFLESWSSGTPVVSLKVDPDQVIESSGLGTVSGTVEQAVRDIREFIDSPQRRDETGLRARRHIADSHSEHRVIEIFERALARPDA